jgi:hypothetical protein
MRRFALKAATLAVLVAGPSLAAAGEPTPAPAAEIITQRDPAAQTLQIQTDAPPQPEADAPLPPQAEAGIAAPTQQPVSTQQTQPQQQQQYYYYYRQPQQQRQGFFGRMMDLERRKNRFLLRIIGVD